jgi:hypothetical protein
MYTLFAPYSSFYPFSLAWPPWEVDEGGVKMTERDEPVGVVIHVCMEITQGNSLCSYLCLKLVKKVMFLFVSFMSFLLQNWRTGGQNRFCLGLGVVGTGGRGG